ncbi:MAG: hypothetical protein HYV09_02615 [Deltaproteobacteria bacterium]|nr:hypothetical protein [Deltaproteobacteria bacterium]
MPTVEYFLVAESVSVDQTSNAVSVFNILEELRPARFPASLPLVVIVCALAIDATELGAEIDVTVRVRRTSGQVDELPASFKATGRRHRQISRLQGLPIEQPGELRFDLLVNGRLLASYVVIVTSDTRPTRPPAIGYA